MKDYLKYVDLNIGSVSYLLATSPLLCLRPFGYAKAVLKTPCNNGDRYFTQYIEGMSVGPATLMFDRRGGDFKAEIDHVNEIPRPDLYSVVLENKGLKFSVTTSKYSVHLKCESDEKGSIVFSANVDKFKSFEQVNSNSIILSGLVNDYDFAEGVETFLYISFTEKIKEIENKNNLYVVSFVSDTKKLCAKASISYISKECAFQNAQIDSLSFIEAEKESKAEWNEYLSRIEVEGSKKEKRIFYTAFARTLFHMNKMDEACGAFYSGFDRKVHKTSEPFYNIDNQWDTFRTFHPLQLLLFPDLKCDMIKSYIKMYEMCGFLPQFPNIEGDEPVMLGNHTASMIYDAYINGVRDFDVEKAYEAMKVTELEHTHLPWKNCKNTVLDEFYHSKGYFPALDNGEEESVEEVHSFERRQAVSVTLEHAYDSFCIAQMAKALGKEDDYLLFMEKSKNYRNLYNKETGYFSPKNSKGEWIDFDPYYGGGQGGRAYFAECNATINQFFVPHDIPALIDLMGGKEKFTSRLDKLFAEVIPGIKYSFLSVFPDSTALMGQYCHGNEPAFHIPYLYNYSTNPKKGQKILRTIMDIWYNDTPNGICGDEDNGAMSAWYIFSSLGFYPICPALPYYDLGSPIFPKSKINLQNGKTLTILAKGTSLKNKYVNDVKFNGVSINKRQIDTSMIREGGVLEFIMGVR